MHRNVPFWGKIQAFPGRGHSRPHRDTLPRPCSPRCLDLCRAFDACDASTPYNFSQFLLFLCLSVLKMYWVVLTADCRNSVCRNRVCRNSVCRNRVCRNSVCRNRVFRNSVCRNRVCRNSVCLPKKMFWVCDVAALAQYGKLISLLKATAQLR